MEELTITCSYYKYNTTTVSQVVPAGGRDELGVTKLEVGRTLILSRGLSRKDATVWETFVLIP